MVLDSQADYEGITLPTIKEGNIFHRLMISKTIKPLSEKQRRKEKRRKEARLEELLEAAAPSSAQAQLKASPNIAALKANEAVTRIKSPKRGRDGTIKTQ
jgi:hypothetical protein